ncbi:hypothetical protein [Photobacterium nomapromontoriensis]|uniref:hypothetical protein n=1 Tax=Photobacterium nomapromontoriensis TaxID=2910237 RepID=UPI003D152A3E
MLVSMLRVFMLVLCFGVVWPSHASSELSVPNESSIMQHLNAVFTSPDTLIMPAHVTQHLAESASFDAFFAQSHGNPQALDSDHTLVWDFGQDNASGHSPAEQSQSNQHSQESRSLDPALACSSRMANLHRQDPEEIESLYQLAIELPIEPAPSFAKNYSVDFHSALDWTLKAPSSSSRISGWKDSNLIYTLYPHRLSLA